MARTKKRARQEKQQRDLLLGRTTPPEKVPLTHKEQAESVCDYLKTEGWSKWAVDNGPIKYGGSTFYETSTLDGNLQPLIGSSASAHIYGDENSTSVSVVFIFPKVDEEGLNHICQRSVKITFTKHLFHAELQVTRHPKLDQSVSTPVYRMTRGKWEDSTMDFRIQAIFARSEYSEHRAARIKWEAAHPE